MIISFFIFTIQYIFSISTLLINIILHKVSDISNRTNLGLFCSIPRLLPLKTHHLQAKILLLLLLLPGGSLWLSTKLSLKKNKKSHLSPLHTIIIIQASDLGKERDATPLRLLPGRPLPRRPRLLLLLLPTGSHFSAIFVPILMGDWLSCCLCSFGFFVKKS